MGPLEQTVAKGPKPLVWEGEPCKACDGRGTYGTAHWGNRACRYCLRGWKLTARGKAARAYFLASLPTKPVEALVVGDRFQQAGRKYTVLAPPVLEGPDGSGFLVDGVKQPYLTVQVVQDGWGQIHWGMIPGTKVDLIPTPEQRAALLAAAVAYQGTLTKSGKVAR